MLAKPLATLSLGLTLLLGAAALTTTAARAADTEAATKAPAKVYTVADTAEFTKLVKATLEALAAGKQAEVVTNLTDLETAWDDKADALKPKDEAVWTMLDKTLDKAISALRSSHTDLAKGKAALEQLLKQIDETTKA